MYAPKDLRLIIRNVLRNVVGAKPPLYTVDAEELLLMIAAHESKLGTYVRQIGGGPALGVFQMEPDTLYDNYDNFVDQRPALARSIERISGVRGAVPGALEHNIDYAVIHARLKLYRSPGKLPNKAYLVDMAEYAKKYYNSQAGRATADDYLRAYRKLVLRAEA